MISRASIPFLAGLLSLGLSFTSPVGAQHDSDAAHQGPAMNFHRIDQRLATGGHFAGAGVNELAKQGVSLVIDLRDQPPAGQEKLLAAVGIRWINVPVVWAAPKLKDFEAFREIMVANRVENILVQCQANYRASAMTYLYRVAEEGVPELEARKDLNSIWVPEGVWQEFIDEVLGSGAKGPAED